MSDGLLLSGLASDLKKKKEKKEKLSVTSELAFG